MLILTTTKKVFNKVFINLLLLLILIKTNDVLIKAIFMPCIPYYISY